MSDERRHTQDEMLGRIAAIGESNSKQLMEIRLALKEYVTKEEFYPIKATVYGMVAMILIGFFGVIIRWVINKGG